MEGDSPARLNLQKKKDNVWEALSFFFYLDGAPVRRSLSEEYRTPNKISAVPAKKSGVMVSCRIKIPSAMDASG